MGEYQGAVLDRVFSAVSDPTRRDILARLADADARVTDLAARLPDLAELDVEAHPRPRRCRPGAPHGARPRAHPAPRRGAALRRGRLDRPLPPLLERAARRARRVRHRPRPADGGRRDRRLRGHRAAGDRGAGRGPLRRLARRGEPRHAGSGPATIAETRAETDPRDGGAFRIVMVNDDTDILHSGTYREIDRPRRLVFTWTSPATQLPRLGRDRDVRAVGGRRPSSRSTRSGSRRRGAGRPRRRLVVRRPARARPHPIRADTEERTR